MGRVIELYSFRAIIIVAVGSGKVFDARSRSLAYPMMLFYSLGLTLALVVSAPWWLFRMAMTDRYREGLGERLGHVPKRLLHGRRVIWVHAVSVGEVLAATRMVAELDAALPEHRVVISTTTKAGQALARQRFGAERVFYFPLDFAFAVRSYLKALKPEAVVLMESELWPRMLVECERAGAPVVVVNARVSDRSFPRYMALRFLWEPLLQKVTMLLAQSEEDGARWKKIGARRVQVTGNMKFDVRAAAETELLRAVREHLPADAKLLVCGSTLEGEESALLKCWRLKSAQGVLLLAPRHPQRFEAVAKLVEQRGFNLLRLSVWRNAPTAIADGDVLLLDSIGELAGMYSLAASAFIGGSLVDAGGHNPLEAAQYSVPVFMGPHYANFRGVVDAMRKRDAIRIVSESELCGAVQGALSAPDVAMGERGRVCFESQAGATERTVAQIMQVLRERA